MSDSGEGRWTTPAAVGQGVPAPVISAALFGRFESRGDADNADRLLSAMRKQFGGHDEKKAQQGLSLRGARSGACPPGGAPALSLSHR